jgi:hypothetical protein
LKKTINQGKNMTIDSVAIEGIARAKGILPLITGFWVSMGRPVNSHSTMSISGFFLRVCCVALVALATFVMAVKYTARYLRDRAHRRSQVAARQLAVVRELAVPIVTPITAVNPTTIREIVITPAAHAICSVCRETLEQKEGARPGEPSPNPHYTEDDTHEL